MLLHRYGIVIQTNNVIIVFVFTGMRLTTPHLLVEKKAHKNKLSLMNRILLVKKGQTTVKGRLMPEKLKEKWLLPLRSSSLQGVSMVRNI